MAIDVLQTVDVIEVMENFIESIRPAVQIRDEVDLSYKIEGQSVVVFEIRSRMLEPKEKIEFPVAKATFVKTEKTWKVFWRRADMKWHSYKPKPIVKTLAEFVKLIDEDEHCCFWG